jgi:hypothetical protein
MTGWGYSPYGISPYGSAAVGVGVSIASANAISTNEVDVTVNGVAQDNSPYLDGDALNPVTWNVRRLDTGDLLTPVSVTQVGTSTYRVLCLEHFGPVTAEHRISSTTLNDASGNLLHAPYFADFQGLLAAAEASNAAKLAQRGSSSTDLANPQAVSSTAMGGTLIINAAGDYANVTGTELVKKLILRRLMTTPGDFFHLPDYGVGLGVKEPLPTSQLAQLKARIEQQVMLEREVEAASAAISVGPGNLTTIRVQAKLRSTGQTVQLSVTQPSGVVSL